MSDKQDGFSMIATVLIVLLMMSSVIGVTTLVISQGRITGAQRQSTKALNIADAGLEKAKWIFRNNPTTATSFFPLNEDFGGGEYQVTISQPEPEIDPDHYIVESTGNVNNEASRTVKSSVFKYSFWKFAYSGDPITTLQGNARIIGSVYVKSNLIMDSGNAGIERGPLYVKQNITLGNNQYIGGYGGGGGWDEDQSPLYPPITLYLEGTKSDEGNYSIGNEYNWVPEISLPPVDMAYLLARATDNGSVINSNVTLVGRTSNESTNTAKFIYTVLRQKKGVFNLTEITPPGIQAASFNAPEAVATDFDDNIYVADTNNNRIQMFDVGGTLKLTWGGATTYDGIALNKPSGITVDNSPGTRYAYVSDSVNNRILKFEITKTVDPDDGSISYSQSYTGTKWTSGLSNPQNVALDSTGRVYAASAGNNKIIRYTGAIVEERITFTTSTSPLRIESFSSPEGISVGSSGNVFVADTGNDKIIKFNSSLNYVNETSGPNAATRPKNCYVINNFIYAAEAKAAGPATNQIARTAYDTTSYDDRRTYSTNLNQPQSVVVDSSGAVVIADTGNNRVKVFREGQSGLTVNGITYINGNLTINDGVIYTLLNRGVIAVNGNISISARGGRRYFRQNPVADTDIDNWTLQSSVGLISNGTVSVEGSGTGGLTDAQRYEEPDIHAVVYGATQIDMEGPFTVRGLVASQLLNFEQVPVLFVQRPVVMPLYMPGDDGRIYIGGWEEVD